MRSVTGRRRSSPFRTPWNVPFTAASGASERVSAARTTHECAPCSIRAGPLTALSTTTDGLPPGARRCNGTAEERALQNRLVRRDNGVRAAPGPASSWEVCRAARCRPGDGLFRSEASVESCTGGGRRRGLVQPVAGTGGPGDVHAIPDRSHYAARRRPDLSRAGGELGCSSRHDKGRVARLLAPFPRSLGRRPAARASRPERRPWGPRGPPASGSVQQSDPTRYPGRGSERTRQTVRWTRCSTSMAAS